MIHPHHPNHPNPPPQQCVQLPFSLNFGWITAATLANVNILAVAQDRGDLPSQLAAAVCSCGKCVCMFPSRMERRLHVEHTWTAPGCILMMAHGPPSSFLAYPLHTQPPRTTPDPTTYVRNQCQSTNTVVVGLAAVLGAWGLGDPVYVAVLVRGFIRMTVRWPLWMGLLCFCSGPV